MLFFISFTLALLVITGGLFLLIKSKQNLGKFFKVMAWIIISCGFFTIFASVHLAVFKFVMHRHEKSMMEKQSPNFHHRNLMGKFDRFCGNEQPFEGKEEMDIVTMHGKPGDGNANPDIQSKDIMKIMTDNNVKLTPDQEKTIKSAIDEALKKSSKEVIVKEKEK